MKWVLIAIFALFVLFMFYLLLLRWDAKREVSVMGRTEMFVCDVHGALPRKYALNLTGMTQEPLPYCPLCFEDRIRQAGEKMNRRGMA